MTAEQVRLLLKDPTARECMRRMVDHACAWSFLARCRDLGYLSGGPAINGAKIRTCLANGIKLGLTPRWPAVLEIVEAMVPDP